MKDSSTISYFRSSTGLAANVVQWFLSQKHTASGITSPSGNNGPVGTILCCSQARELDCESWLQSCLFHFRWRFVLTRRNVCSEINKEVIKSKRLLMIVSEAENTNLDLRNLELRLQGRDLLTSACWVRMFFFQNSTATWSNSFQRNYFMLSNFRSQTWKISLIFSEISVI